MDVNDLFNKESISKIEEALNDLISKNNKATKLEVAVHLGLIKLNNDKSLSVEEKKEIESTNLLICNIIGSLISLNIIKGFKNVTGFGICFEDYDSSKVNPISEEFINKVKETCEKTFEKGSSKRISRAEFAKLMGMPGSDTENKISIVFNDNKIEGFDLKRGRFGGIGRKVFSLLELLAKVKIDEKQNIINEINSTI